MRGEFNINRMVSLYSEAIRTAQRIVDINDDSIRSLATKCFIIMYKHDSRRILTGSSSNTVMSFSDNMTRYMRETQYSFGDFISNFLLDSLKT